MIRKYGAIPVHARLRPRYTKYCTTIIFYHCVYGLLVFVCESFLKSMKTGTFFAEFTLYLIFS